VSLTISTFLMFEGKAEEAMNFYVSLFPTAKVESVTRFGPNEAGAEGSIMQAVFSLDGKQRFICFDSPAKHAFTFTPATSIFVEYDTVGEVEALAPKLSEGGNVLMPLDSYPFSPKFIWVADRYGVSWQICARK
jgi:predicted 3-demethylubiquinone-9 3-methyltransferase (glyoxalase superfamily)